MLTMLWNENDRPHDGLNQPLSDAAAAGTRLFGLADCALRHQHCEGPSLGTVDMKKDTIDQLREAHPDLSQLPDWVGIQSNHFTALQAMAWTLHDLQQQPASKTLGMAYLAAHSAWTGAW